MNIKKMFWLFIILTVIYFGMQFGFKETSRGHHVSYMIKSNGTKLEIEETYTHHEKQEEDNYFFEINDGHNTFTFQIFEEMGNRNYVIKEIAYFKGKEYQCIYPKFKTGKHYTDILCAKEGIIYPYQSIKGISKEVEQFQKEQEEYAEERYQDDISDTLKKETLIIYRNNMQKNHFLALEHYKGIYLINQKDVYKKVDLFAKDQYTKELSAFVGTDYLVADYRQAHTFNELLGVNIKTGKKSKIISDKALNLDAYVMGVIDGKVYVYDRSKKEQYTIHVKRKSISKIGDTSSGIQIYENKAWKDYSSYDAYQQKVTFEEYKVTDSKWKKYDRVDLVGNQKSGYYYFYLKTKDHYEVYQASVQQPEVRTYLFATTNIDNIVYQQKYIYFIYGNDIFYYHPDTYLHKVITNTEFAYNTSLKFTCYVS